jgi:hypothetical protein
MEVCDDSGSASSEVEILVSRRHAAVPGGDEDGHGREDGTKISRERETAE